MKSLQSNPVEWPDPYSLLSPILWHTSSFWFFRSNCSGGPWLVSRVGGCDPSPSTEQLDLENKAILLKSISHDSNTYAYACPHQNNPMLDLIAYNHLFQPDLRGPPMITMPSNLNSYELIVNVICIPSKEYSFWTTTSLYESSYFLNTTNGDVWNPSAKFNCNTASDLPSSPITFIQSFLENSHEYESLLNDWTKTTATDEIEARIA